MTTVTPNASSVQRDLQSIELASRFRDEALPHGNRGICRRCGQDGVTSPMGDLVIVFRECICGRPAEPHVVEQLAHRQCFAGLVAADILRDQAAEQATSSRDFGRGYAHAIALLRGAIP